MDAFGAECKPMHRLMAGGDGMAIEDILDEGLPRAYTKELFESKSKALFEHVYESYFGDGDSVYAEAA